MNEQTKVRRRAFRLVVPLAMAVLGCWLLCMSGCESADQPSSGGDAPTTNADGTANLARHRQTIHYIMEESLALFDPLSNGGITASPSATDEQKEKLNQVASPWALGEVKDPVIAFDIWMDNLSPDQARELDGKLDALQAWITELQDCYAFAEGSGLAEVKSRVVKLEQHVKAIKADLPK